MSPNFAMVSRVTPIYFCGCTQVQALYQLSSPSLESAETQRAIKLAKKLELSVVGCVYSYDGTKRAEGDAVHGTDVMNSSKLQIENMRATKSNKFTVLPMEAQSGATEAFQLSDISVQMIHEVRCTSIQQLKCYNNFACIDFPTFFSCRFHFLF